jgi:sugar lactone lactonase YvrE
MADRIRKINVSTRDTARLLVYSDLAPSARIQSIDVGPNGEVYAADFSQDVVYKIFENGRVSGVLAGKLGVTGVVHATGVGTSTGLTARFDSPIGLAVDNSGNIYVGCASGLLIRKLSPSGRVIPFAGNATSSGDVVSDIGTDAKFATDGVGMGICVDKAGIVYLADSGNHKIKKIFPSGKVTTLAGGPGGAGATGFVNANGNTARFATPRDVAVDASGNVYVADTSNHRIRKITPMGDVTTLAGGSTPGSTDGNGLNAKFTTPQRLAIDPSGQFLYVMESPGSGRIRRVDMHGTTTTFMHYNGPTVLNGDLTVDRSGFLYVLEKDS